VKAQPDAGKIGMMLVHRGVVRETTRSGDPVSAMDLSYDRKRLDEVVADARTWQGVIAVRAWVNEGHLSVGDDIMGVLVAGDIRPNVFAALERLVSIIKTEVVIESETP
jgi:molybdopterin synthase catalytic subunit